MDTIRDFCRVFLCTLFIVVAAAVIVAVILLPINWYSAKAQAEVWQRQGYDITAEEVFWGAKPMLDKASVTLVE